MTSGVSSERCSSAARASSRRVSSASSACRCSATSAVIPRDRKSTRLNSSHDQISYAVFCLKKKKRHRNRSGETRSTRQNAKDDQLRTALPSAHKHVPRAPHLSEATANKNRPRESLGMLRH